MPRRKAAIKREVLPDPLFGSDQVAKFINVVMRAGKKSIAETIVYNALNTLTDRLKKESKGDKGEGEGEGGKGKKTAAASPKSKTHTHSKQEILESLQKALGNVAPTVEVKSRRVGGATYQVPVEVAADRGLALAMRWVVKAAKSRSEKTMALRLAAELYEACMGRGASVKTRDDVHRMAKANQAFAHYRW
ncbi:30S ribosomal protein S7 [Aquicella lusitana]|uniref:Small ribosomal subunit protein uS7 n=1 Tax=Aquicella lusitana TaxID=254246 RepID=A0A370GU16_9COXI|nr:30S ribosomal protein S7 [Aquicella lusitana]RDI46981.1 SSU ribosomal protein S7P [Aquicella lusitana]VVC73871.1 30S ribosomal protein S7 [Aquicella lusitana]